MVYTDTSSTYDKLLNRGHGKVDDGYGVEGEQI
jgi:hypothetical protein